MKLKDIAAKIGERIKKEGNKALVAMPYIRYESFDKNCPVCNYNYKYPLDFEFETYFKNLYGYSVGRWGRGEDFLVVCVNCGSFLMMNDETNKLEKTYFKDKEKIQELIDVEFFKDYQKAKRR